MNSQVEQCIGPEKEGEHETAYTLQCPPSPRTSACSSLGSPSLGVYGGGSRVAIADYTPLSIVLSVRWGSYGLKVPTF